MANKFLDEGDLEALLRQAKVMMKYNAKLALDAEEMSKKMLDYYDGEYKAETNEIRQTFIAKNMLDITKAVQVIQGINKSLAGEVNSWVTGKGRILSKTGVVDSYLTEQLVQHLSLCAMADRMNIEELTNPYFINAIFEDLSIVNSLIV